MGHDADADAPKQQNHAEPGAVQGVSTAEPVELLNHPLDSVLEQMVSALQDVRGVLTNAVDTFPIDRAELALAARRIKLEEPS